jgi:hypothetical protein
VERDAPHHPQTPAIRSVRVWTLQPSPRRQPTSVMPTSLVTSTARDDGANMAASTGMPA